MVGPFELQGEPPDAVTVVDGTGARMSSGSVPTIHGGQTRARVEGSSMEFQDKVLKCIDCGADFVFTAGEQLFFHDKQFKNEPKRCKPCKAKRATALGIATPGAYPKVETRTVCSECGKETTVPFKPTQGRPVYCRECFQQKRTAPPQAAAATASNP